ncbi:MAG: toll/interleukin-1 receptor domain-containing protein, partial [Alphaproteobacteria bacterium]|nr:toll/interleukin-1 receptor domain-containing protein [Alphaproteobacteria bacterium]
MVQVFISHSSRDTNLAKSVIDLLRSALNLPASEIRCTSVPGYKLPGGAETDNQLRSELLEAPVFVGLVTEAGMASAYVLFELGARWGAKKQLIPLLAPGVSPSIL